MLQTSLIEKIFSGDYDSISGIPFNTPKKVIDNFFSPFVVEYTEENAIPFIKFESTVADSIHYVEKLPPTPPPTPSNELEVEYKEPKKTDEKEEDQDFDHHKIETEDTDYHSPPLPPLDVVTPPQISHPVASPIIPVQPLIIRILYTHGRESDLFTCFDYAKSFVFTLRKKLDDLKYANVHIVFILWEYYINSAAAFLNLEGKVYHPDYRVTKLNTDILEVWKHVSTTILPEHSKNLGIDIFLGMSMGVGPTCYLAGQSVIKNSETETHHNMFVLQAPFNGMMQSYKGYFGMASMFSKIFTDDLFKKNAYYMSKKNNRSSLILQIAEDDDTLNFDVEPWLIIPDAIPKYFYSTEKIITTHNWFITQDGIDRTISHILYELTENCTSPLRNFTSIFKYLGIYKDDELISVSLKDDDDLEDDYNIILTRDPSFHSTHDDD